MRKKTDQWFTGSLQDKDLYMIEDALEMYKAFKVYGDGREEHQKKCDELIQKLYLFVEGKHKKTISL